jgi:hypothetical protein
VMYRIAWRICYGLASFCAWNETFYFVLNGLLVLMQTNREFIWPRADTRSLRALMQSL